MIPITQSTFFSVWGLPLDGAGSFFLLLLSLIGFSKGLECSRQNQYEFSESWNIPQFQCWIISKTSWPMWDSLKPDWNRTRIMWLESKISALNVSPIESGETESNPVENRESNQVGNNESNKVRHSESNKVRRGESEQVGNNDQRGTADADDGASAGYPTRQWSGSWRSGGVIAVIVTSA